MLVIKLGKAMALVDINLLCAEISLLAKKLGIELEIIKIEDKPIDKRSIFSGTGG